MTHIYSVSFIKCPIYVMELSHIIVLENIQFTKWPISIVCIAHVTSKLFHVFSSQNIFKKIETWWRDEIICHNSNSSVFLEQIIQGILVLAIELVWFDGIFVTIICYNVYIEMVIGMHLNVFDLTKVLLVLQSMLFREITQHNNQVCSRQVFLSSPFHKWDIWVANPKIVLFRKLDFSISYFGYFQ